VRRGTHLQVLRGAERVLGVDLCEPNLNQCDLRDLEANTREVFRVLKPADDS
jgi:hypothetical protein